MSAAQTDGIVWQKYDWETNSPTIQIKNITTDFFPIFSSPLPITNKKPSDLFVLRIPDWYTVAGRTIGFAFEQPLNVIALACSTSGILK
ncbi:MAG: hypothetical protein LBJ00_05955 [Planctomycetaceae bacterium]|nr:hypothetical protein [Planctomycetaceae bacterium]